MAEETHSPSSARCNYLGYNRKHWIDVKCRIKNVGEGTELRIKGAFILIHKCHEIILSSENETIVEYGREPYLWYWTEEIIKHGAGCSLAHKLRQLIIDPKAKNERCKDEINTGLYFYLAGYLKESPL